MPNTRAAEQAMRQSTRRRDRNRLTRTRARTYVKQATGLVAGGISSETEQSVKEAIRALDKASQKGIIKKNNAARRKSRLMKKLNGMRAAKPASA